MKRYVIAAVLVVCIVTMSASAADPNEVIRLGMIGLDTSHVIAFTKMINDPARDYGCKVVVGYSGGSADIPSSADRVQGYTKDLREKYGLEIVDSIEELCGKVDGVLLESVDGRPHLEQARPVIEAGLPLYVDKPMAGSLADVLEIFRLADEKKAPCWSSSSLRFSKDIIGMRDNEAIGDVLGCAAFSPCSIEEHHPDLYWYGVHGVEILFTIMGPGCRSVRRVQTDGTELVVGTWEDGRIGTYRGIKKGKSEYGAVVFGSKSVSPAGKYQGYGPLVEEIVKFFKTGQIPVDRRETIEIFAFMSGADVSKERNGAAVSIPMLIEQAKAENAAKRKKSVGGE